MKETIVFYTINIHLDFLQNNTNVITDRNYQVIGLIIIMGQYLYILHLKNDPTWSAFFKKRNRRKKGWTGEGRKRKSITVVNSLSQWNGKQLIVSEQHLTCFYQAQDVKTEPGEIMSYDRAGRPWGRCTVVSCEKQEAKRSTSYHASMKKWEDRWMRRKMFYPQIKTKHGSWDLNAHLWYKRISILFS